MSTNSTAKRRIGLKKKRNRKWNYIDYLSMIDRMNITKGGRVMLKD